MVAFKNALLMATLAGYALGAPVLVARQGAGVGQGCNAILTDADTSSGQIVKQGGAYIAKKLGGGGLGRRQGAGVGAGCDSILTDADTSSGQIVKQGGAYIAKELENAQGGAKTSSLKLPSAKAPAAKAPAAPKAPKGPGGKRDLDSRQLDKVGAGVGYVVEALPGGSEAGEEVTSSTGTIDGNGTNGSAQLGEAVGEAELSVGNAVTETAFGTTSGPAGPPSKRDIEARQLDKAGAGIGYIVGALPGGSKAGQQITSSTGTIDGEGTTGSAQLGQKIGQGELDLGNDVTKTAFGTTDGASGGSSSSGAAPKGGKAPAPAGKKPAAKGPGGPKGPK